MIYDLQKERFFRIFDEGIPRFLEMNKFENDDISISYELLNKPEIGAYNSAETVSSLLTVQAKVVAKNNDNLAETLTFPIDILRVPAYTEDGFIINGTSYQILGSYKPGAGWYLTKEDKESSYSLSFQPKRGPKFEFIGEPGNIKLTIGNSEKIPLAVFMKALTDKTYFELINLIGSDLNCVINAFSIPDTGTEPSVASCLKQVLSAMVNTEIRNVRDVKNEVYSRVYSGNYIDVGHESRVRAQEFFSFRRRAQNKILAENIVLPDNRVLTEGTILYAHDLDQIDELGKHSLKIRDNGRIYTLYKYNLSDTLSPGELYTALNILACSIEGYPITESKYSLDNRVVKPLDTLFEEALISNIKKASFLIRDSYNAEKKNLTRHAFKINLSRDLDSFINSLVLEERSVQQTDSNNLLAYVSKGFKVMSNYSSAGSAPDEMVNIQESQLGRLDSFEAPESKQIGKVHSMTLMAKIDDNGFLTSPYMKVENGQIIGEEPVYLTALDEKNKHIAAWNETFENDKVEVRYNGRILKVSKDKVDYKEYSQLQQFSPARSCIPFPDFLNGKRSLMGSNQQKQSVPLIKPQRPLVSTGADSLVDVGFFRASGLIDEFIFKNRRLLESQGINFDELKQSRITLIDSTTSLGIKTYIFTIDYPNLRDNLLSKTVAHFRKSTNETINHFKLNASENMTWQGDDIVLYHISLDIKKREVDGLFDYGGASKKIKKSEFEEKALALGTNLKVIFKTWESSTIDDAMVINQDLLASETLTSISLVEITAELRSGETYSESFGMGNHKHLTYTGIPPVGIYLKPTDVVIGRFSEEIKKQRSNNRMDLTKDKRDKSVRLDATQEGQVIYSNIDGDTATVILARSCSVNEGDKFAGRYGNKGVCAKIVRREFMPFTEEGEIADIILNPLGIPSRMNISQLLEVVLAYAMDKLGKVAIIAPFSKNSKEFVEEQATLAGIKDTYIYDARTGIKSTRPVNFGIQHMLKLEHMVHKKVTAINIPSRINQTTLQPLQGKKSGAPGQAFGEMETWCLMAVGAHKVLQDLLSVQSDDLRSLNTLTTQLAGNPFDIAVNGENNVDLSTQIIFRSLGVELKNSNSVKDAYEFTPLTDAMIRGFFYRPLSIESVNSLHDPMVFGNPQDPDPISLRKRWGYLDLGVELIMPFWINFGQLSKLIVCYQQASGSEKWNRNFLKAKSLNEVVAGNSGFLFEDGAVKFKKFGTMNTGGFETGIQAIVKLFKRYSWHTSIEFIHAQLDRDISNERRWELKSTLADIDLYAQRGLSLDKFVNRLFPIMPTPFRVQSKSLGNNVRADFDIHYNNIMRLVKQVNLLPSKNNIGDLYAAVERFTGLPSDEEERTSKNKKNIHNLLSYFKGRGQDDDGYIRGSILKKRLLFSGRSVIIPSSDTKMTPMQCGLPITMAVEIYKIHLKELLRRLPDLENYRSDFELTTILDAVVHKDIFTLKSFTSGIKEDAVKLYSKLFNLVKTFIEGRVVLLGRQPSLHQLSIRAYYPKLTTKLSIEVHPLMCKGYNADFDGDQMWVAGLVNNEACEEAIELLSAKSALLNPKDGSIVLSHTQDMVLGCYFATMLHDNRVSIEADNRYNAIYPYSNINLLKADVESGFLSVHSLVSFRYKTKNYLSTAGRVLFNSLLPNGWGFTEDIFTNPLGIPNIKIGNYYNLRFDGLLRDGKGKSPLVTQSIKAINRALIENFDTDTVVATAQAIMEFGFYHSDVSCISMRLQDISQHPKTALFVEKATELVDKLNSDFDKGLLSEEDRKRTAITIYSKCKNNLANIFLKEFDRNNNLFIMADSGARGSLDQIMQTCGIIGVIAKIGDEMLESPVLSNYGSGLSSFETHIASYGTRAGVASTQNETADSGYCTRQTVYMNSGFKIVENDCGCTHDHSKVKLTFTTPKNHEITVSKLLNKNLHPDYEYFYLVKNLLGVNNLLTSDAIKVLLKNHVPYVKCVNEEVKIGYKLENFWSSLLLYRFTKDQSLPYLIKGNFISAKTVEYIEQNDIRELDVQLMLNCKSIGGVCAYCYGLKYKNLRLPEVGEYVGFEAAQAIGEPSAQLVMSKINQGGLAGDDVSGGVKFYGALLDANIPKKALHAVVAPESGYISVKSSGNKVIVELGSHRWKFDRRLVTTASGESLIRDGEFIHQYTPLTNGFIKPQFIGENESLTDDELFSRKLALFRLYYNTFKNSNIDIYARHFEILVRLQTQYTTVLDGTNTPFLSGRIYDINEIKAYEQQENADIPKSIPVSNKYTVIKESSGVLACLAFERIASFLGKFTVHSELIHSKSPISKLFIGENVVTGNTKYINTPRPVEDVEEIIITSEDKSDTIFSKEYSNLESDNVVIMDDIFSDLLGDDVETIIPDVIEREAAIDLSFADSFEVIDEDIDSLSDNSKEKLKESTSF